MKRFMQGLLSRILLGLAVTAPNHSIWAVNDQPIREKWSPSEWGADDKAGSVNRTTPAMVLRAVKLVKKGKVATLGKVYQQDLPLSDSRGWRMLIPGLPTAGPIGDQKMVYNDEYLATQIGQVGTQFDGPGHIGVRTSKGDFFYNGRFLEDDDINSQGLGSLGVEHVAQTGFVCRGILLDAVAHRGGRLPVPTSLGQNDPGIVTVADVKKMIEKQGIEPIREGDCVFLYTGHGDIWHPSKWDSFSADEKRKRSKEFNAGSPGFGISACEYLASRKIILWGGDTPGTEAAGLSMAGENAQPFECHIKMMTRSGIWNIENLDFTQLLADKVYEFLFAWSPLKLKGATGSPGNPVAIY
ncbi:MAG: cyclase family protein [Gammaproteobacteria bacterium]|nr:cyclase family protein [Gammaproteobacteria bacterium]